MFNKVFISYAREDFESAKNMFEYLEANNFIPWMDKMKLLVGQRWENQIMKELRIADFIIILLSQTSVAKRGFVQKEFKEALKYAEEKLNTDIFILPIKLDDCNIPEELSVFNWVDFDNETHSKISQSLNYQRNKIINSLPKDLIDLNNFTEHNIKLEGRINSIYNYDIKYPTFRNTLNNKVNMLNTEIEHYINNHISFLNKELLYEVNEILERIDSYDQKYSLETSYSVGIVNEKNISILFYEFYDFLGAHPNHSWTSINIAFNPNRVLNYRDISNFSQLGDLIKNYKYDFDEISNELLLQNLQYFNEYSNNEYFSPKQFEFLIIDEETILIIFSNHMPHALKSMGHFVFKYKTENEKLILFN